MYAIKHDDAESNIGRRIRIIRKEQNISQAELGEAVGLNANRVQQYENGARNPKLDLCRQIADALGVDVNALQNPDPKSPIGVMYTLFELETLYGLRLEEVDGRMCMYFGENWRDANISTLNQWLKLWLEKQKGLEEAAGNVFSEDEMDEKIREYNMWEWNFPFGVPKAKQPNTTIEHRR